MIRIALRFDDPSPTSDHELERQLLAILARLDIPITAAVVPFGRNREPIQADNVPHLVAAHAAGLLEVAQHGLMHKPMATNSQGVPSEFQGVPEQEQAHQIDEGLRLLRATFPRRITGFIPPWNTYDTSTLNLLCSRGFEYISISNSTRIWRKPGIRMLSHTCHISQLEGAYLQAKCYNNPAIIIAILHHYDFNGASAGYQHTSQLPGRLEETLNWLRGEADVEFTTLANIAKSISIEAAWRAQLRQHRVSEMHWRVRQYFPVKQLLTRPLWRYLLARKRHAHA
jgi:peptidoglycan/xylan/chitin deacetylase (PgdA/CDA1 family)